MMAAIDYPAVHAYLAELNRLLDGTPDRELIVDGVAQHVEDALGSAPADHARVQAVLEELGDPATIAAEAGSGTAAEQPPFLQRRSGAVLTVALLTLGGLVIPVAGWIVGIGLLWFSKGWNVTDKLVGTFAPFVVAGVLTGGVALFGGGFTHLAVLLGLLLGAIGAALFLLRRFHEGAGV